MKKNCALFLLVFFATTKAYLQAMDSESKPIDQNSPLSITFDDIIADINNLKSTVSKNYETTKKLDNKIDELTEHVKKLENWYEDEETK